MKKEEVIEILESKIEIYRTAIKKHPHLKAYEIEVDENILAYQYAIKVLKEFEGLEKDLAFYKKWMIVYKKRSKQLKQSQLTKEEFHTIACEYIPKWTKGELDKLWEALTEGHWLNIDRPKQRELDDEIFIKHIQSHLQEGQKVICKICGKTVEEIATAFKKGKLSN